VIRAGNEAPPDDVREVFDGRPRRLFRLDRLASVAGGPVALLTAWLSPVRFPGLAAQDFSQVALYATLERLYGVQMGRALSTIEVVQAKDDEAGLLQIPPGGPALQVQGTTFDADDRATEVSRVLYRADRFKFSLESHRVGGELKHVIGTAADGPPFPPAPAAAGPSRRK
jgi:GntR family transcriptional regulator